MIFCKKSRGKIAYFVHTKLVVKEKKSDSARSATENPTTSNAASSGGIPKVPKGAAGGTQGIPPLEPKGPNTRQRNPKK